MALPSPNLDDRTFQDIVDEAKGLIPRYCPEWTDHNLSDPGVTLIELFAWMTEMVLFRLNQVPEKNYLKFLDLLGIRLQPPCAATVELLFRLSAPQSAKVTIPLGTEVATVRTETEAAVVFTTDADLVVDVAAVAHCVATSDGERYYDRSLSLEVAGGEFLAFDPKPRPDNALLIGLTGNLARNLLVLDIRCDIEGIGVSPADPPLVWEAWGSDGRWVPVELLRDTTGGLNRHGLVEMILPAALAGASFGEKYAHGWIRCRVTAPRQGQPFYERSPRVKGISARTLGGVVSATHATAVDGEILGRSDGTPGQTFALRNPPILARRPGETIEVILDDGSVETWVEVEDFADSGPQDRHFTCESATGVVAFGPAIHQPDGTIRSFGAIPAKGARIRFSRYRHGGGVAGNVAAGELSVLKGSIPYVAHVTNRRPARGGAEVESLELAKLRASRLIRARNRAVTADDFECFALRASTAVRRARCIGSVTGDGAVTVCVVPTVPDPMALLSREELIPSRDTVREVEAFLDDRCLLTVHSRVVEADYVWVTVDARIDARAGADLPQIQRMVEEGLCRYLNPLIGGPQGDGWPFGKSLSSFELYPLLLSISGVEAIAELRLLVSDDLDGPLADAGHHVRLSRGAVVCSGRHRLEVRVPS